MTTSIRRFLFLVSLLVLGVGVAPAEAQFVDPFRSLATSAITLDHLNDSAVFRLNGAPYVDATVIGGTTANLCVEAQFSTDFGVTWEERLVFNGDNWVNCDNYPHPSENIRDLHFPVRPSDTHVRLLVTRYTSGSVTATFGAGSTVDIPMYIVGTEEIVAATLGSLNAETRTIVGRMHGQLSAGFHIDAGTCSCTLVVETSPTSHSETDWSNSIFFANSQWWIAGMAITNPNAATDISIPLTGATQKIRLRISSYTSGSLLAKTRVNNAYDALGAAITAGVTGFGGLPVFSNQVAGSDGSLLRALLTDTKGRLITSPCGAATSQFNVQNTPAANTKATISQAAGGANIRNYATAITAVLAAGTAAPTAINVAAQLRDGATGAGTIVWQGTLSVPATAGLTSPPLMLSGLCVRGSANTAMTLEFTAAGGANTFESVALSGVTITEP